VHDALVSEIGIAYGRAMPGTTITVSGKLVIDLPPRSVTTLSTDD
jgi:hypothetical protein